jgi:NAD-dependent dihydropyrimidine dehydrogenase PreA subunit
MSATKVVFCECRYAGVVPKKVKEEVLNKLNKSGLEFETVPDLCEMSAKKDPRLKEYGEEKTIKIAACYPRAVKGLFESAGASYEEEKIEILNMRESTAEEVLAELLPEGHEDKGQETAVDLSTIKHPEGWKPWFPVIDYNRCTNCMQCLSFCLFGVYGVDEEEKIQVQNQDKCKTDCPACSRVCPEVAIMFPKYKAAPINGAPVSDEDLDREKMKIDISSLLGGDIYQTLRDRNVRAKSRFSKERDDDKALKERMRCLNELKETLDIPDSALMSLPSQSEIEENLENAKKGG